MPRALHGIAVLLLLLLPALTGAAPAAVPTRVTLQLQWRHQFEFAGFYAAKAKGYYAEQGLDVDIHELQDGMDPVAMYVAMQDIVGKMRKQPGPHLLEAKT